jgi:hypothetical protein
MEATPLQVAQQSAARIAVLRASASATGPKDGIVAVKVCQLLHLSMHPWLLHSFLSYALGAAGPPLHIVYLREMYETAEWVQVQYPDALQTMLTDLRSIRNWAGYLQKTEIKFDMVSAVDELAKQVSLLLHAPSNLPHAESVWANIAWMPGGKIL